MSRPARCSSVQRIAIEQLTQHSPGPILTHVRAASGRKAMASSPCENPPEHCGKRTTTGLAGGDYGEGSVNRHGANLPCSAFSQWYQTSSPSSWTLGDDRWQRPTDQQL